MADTSDIDRTVVVLGATGQQGGAVATALHEEGWPVRALVRDPSSGRARALSSRGIDTVRGDLSEPDSLRAAFSGAYGVFSVQPNSQQAGAEIGNEDEVRFGTTVADLAERAGIAHLVYSSTVAAGPVPTGVAHLDTKSRVEERVRALKVPSTILRPATFMEILLAPGAIADAELSFVQRPEQSVQFIAVRDIGRIAAAVFAAPDRWIGRTEDIAGDALTGAALAESLTRASGQGIGYRRFSAEALEQDAVLGGIAALVDSGRLVGHADLDALRAEFPFLLTFDHWLAGPGAPLLTEAFRS